MMIVVVSASLMHDNGDRLGETEEAMVNGQYRVMRSVKTTPTKKRKPPGNKFCSGTLVNHYAAD